MKTMIRPAVSLMIVFSAITGVLYPLAITGLAQVSMPHQANGSLIQRGNRIVGSELLGQAFHSPGYFWSRPSATAPFPYNAGASMGSNLGPSNPALKAALDARVAALRAAQPDQAQNKAVPIDLVTSSGSGLDPHISLASAYYQIARVAQARAMDPGMLRELVDQQMEGRLYGYKHEPRVNVVLLNLALDKTTPDH